MAIILSPERRNQVVPTCIWTSLRASFWMPLAVIPSSICLPNLPKRPSIKIPPTQFLIRYYKHRIGFEMNRLQDSWDNT